MDGFFRFLAEALRALGRHFTTFDPLLQVGMIGGAIALFVLWRWGVALARKRRDLKWQERRARLLETLLERGLPADDAVRVLGATLGNVDADVGKLTKAIAARATGLDLDAILGAQSNDPTAQVVKVLAENSYDTDDIDAILSAARSVRPIDARIVSIVTSLAENGAEGEGIAKILMSDARHEGVAIPTRPEIG